MKEQEVPQDAAILEQWHEITYATDDQGHYVLVPSRGWDPANLANIQAWDVIREELEQALGEIRAGRFSPLYYHMLRFQMDAGLLAGYVGLSRWRVKRHLRPGGYAKMKQEARENYCRLFNLPDGGLDLLPEQPELPVTTENHQ